MSPSTSLPASAAPASTGRDIAGIVAVLEAIRIEHEQLVTVNEELFRALLNDTAVDAGERQKARLAAAGAHETCVRVDEALRAVAAGTYGSCVSCHEVIAYERLVAVPLTRTCVDCPPR